MTRRFPLLFLALAFLPAVLPSPASAQCVLSLTGELIDGQGAEFAISEVKVWLQIDGIADAVSYRMDLFGGQPDAMQLTSEFGPTGSGINIETSNGSNVGLGECAVGFSGPILVATYTYYFDPKDGIALRVAGNADENPDFPVVSTCGAGLIQCDIGAVYQQVGVGVESESFGAVKALFTN